MIGTREVFKNSFQLYSKDWQRFYAIKSKLEDEFGRPHSATDVILHLLDRYDDLVAIEEVELNTGVATDEGKKGRKTNRSSAGRKAGRGGRNRPYGASMVSQ